jgi:hypothetical protein
MGRMLKNPLNTHRFLSLSYKREEINVLFGKI